MSGHISNDRFVASGWRDLYRIAAALSFNVRMACPANLASELGLHEHTVGK